MTRVARAAPTFAATLFFTVSVAFLALNELLA